jgi:hypothetical protein
VGDVTSKFVCRGGAWHGASARLVGEQVGAPAVERMSQPPSAYLSMVAFGLLLIWDTPAALIEADTSPHPATEKTPHGDDLLLRYELLLYSRQIAEAQHAWERGDVAEAWRQLNSCRGDLRGWEHDYLFTHFTKNQQTLRTGGDVASVTYCPDGKRVHFARSSKLASTRM